MLKNILKHVESLKSVDFDPEVKTHFTNVLVKNWRVKGGHLIEAVFCKNSLFSRAKISSSAIIRNSLLIDCEVKSLLSKAPVVSFSKGIIYSTNGRMDVIESSTVKGSEIEIIGNCHNTVFENCELTGGTYISCTFKNCIIKNGNVFSSVVDEDTIIKSAEYKTKFSR